jgi:hypothetical protein
MGFVDKYRRKRFVSRRLSKTDFDAIKALRLKPKGVASAKAKYRKLALAAWRAKRHYNYRLRTANSNKAAKYTLASRANYYKKRAFARKHYTKWKRWF